MCCVCRLVVGNVSSKVNYLVMGDEPGESKISACVRARVRERTRVLVMSSCILSLIIESVSFSNDLFASHCWFHVVCMHACAQLKSGSTSRAVCSAKQICSI